MSEAGALRSELAVWLQSLGWDTFGTFTFRHSRTVDRAAQLFTSFLDTCSDSGVEPSVCCWGAEPHPGGHGGHVHALIKWDPWCSAGAEAIGTSVLWRAKFGRVTMARYCSGAGAAYYLTKYCVKERRDVGTWGLWTKGGRDGSEVRSWELVGASGQDEAEITTAEIQGWEGRQETDDRLDREAWLEQAVQDWDRLEEEARF